MSMFLKKEVSSYVFGETSFFLLFFWINNRFCKWLLAKKKKNHPGYCFIHPTLNQSQKWRYDYIFIVKNKPSKKMDDLLDRFLETMEFSMKRKFNRYIIKVSQVNGSFYVLIRKQSGKILGDGYSLWLKM